MKRLALMLVACSTVALAQSPETGKAELKDATGKTVGSVTLTDTPHGVLMHVKLAGVPAGTHAFHVHATGKCEAPFTSAGGHFNPEAKQHGSMNEMGMHAGDMVDIEVPADGNLDVRRPQPRVTLKAGAAEGSSRRAARHWSSTVAPTTTRAILPATRARVSPAASSRTERASRGASVRRTHPARGGVSTRRARCRLG